MRIIIEMKEGLVSAVYADNKDVSVDVLDYDCLEDVFTTESWRRYYNSLEKQAKSMETVY